MSVSQLSQKFIKDNAVNDLKLRLRNNQPLRARNNAGSGDISMFKVNASDIVEALSALTMGANSLTVAAPTLANHAASKAYVDALSAGLAWKDSVRVATTAALPTCTYANGASGVGATLTGDSNGALAAIDGITLLVNEDILVKNQGSAFENGIYRLTQVGSGGTPFILTRRTDADQDADIVSEALFVQEGTTQEDTAWVMVSDGSVVGTDAQSFVQFGAIVTYVAGAGLTESPAYTFNVGAGDGITVNANDVAVNVSAIAGTGLEDDGSNNLRIAASAAGDGIQGGAGSALSVAAVKARDVLDGTDITNQYVDLGFEALAGSVLVWPKGGLPGEEHASGEFTTSVVGGVTRITFANDWATGGDSALESGDILVMQYIKK